MCVQVLGHNGYNYIFINQLLLDLNNCDADVRIGDTLYNYMAYADDITLFSTNVTHSLTHSPTHPLTRLLTLSLSLSLTNSLTHSFSLFS